jgi:hypothetical protein
MGISLIDDGWLTISLHFLPQIDETIGSVGDFLHPLAGNPVLDQPVCWNDGWFWTLIFWLVVGTIIHYVLICF